MSEPLDRIKQLIDECSEQDLQSLKSYLRDMLPHHLEKEWEIDADTILSAIERSSDLTKRGVRGIIAEAVFVNEIIPTVKASGWHSTVINGDQPYDAVLRKDEQSVRIQVKLQRLEVGKPKLYYPKHYEEGSLFVVEVQKTRTGEKKAPQKLSGTETTLITTESVTVETRPYKFGDFDILAVNMHPSSKDWKSFRYTVASWLLPRANDKSLIEIFQPVAATPNEVWTSDLATCLDWFQSGKNQQVLESPLHLKKLKKGKKGKKKGKKKKNLKKQ